MWEGGHKLCVRGSLRKGGYNVGGGGVCGGWALCGVEKGPVRSDLSWVVAIAIKI